MDSDNIIKKRRGRPPKDTTKPKCKKTGAASRCPTKRVFICSLLSGAIERNMKRAEIYCRFAFDSGFVPVAPHIYYPRFLDDENKIERAAGQRYGLEEMWRCKQLWVFGERISSGMKAEIDLAKELKIPVRYFDSDMEEIG